jgi:hypothetical protein
MSKPIFKTTSQNEFIIYDTGDISKYIELQFVPMDRSITPSQSLNKSQPINRNAPYPHITGFEEEVKFTAIFHMDDGDYIENTVRPFFFNRMMSQSYTVKHPRVGIKWGTATSNYFTDKQFIVTGCDEKSQLYDINGNSYHISLELSFLRVVDVNFYPSF